MSFNTQLKSAFFLMVSAFGIISCAPDKPAPQDHFQVSPPRLVLEDKKTLPWSEVKTFQNIKLTPQAQLELGPEMSADGVRLISYSRCHWLDQRNISLEAHFSQPQKISILQLLPDQILLGRNKTHYSCSFDFVAINRHGSKHFFSLPRAELVTSSAGVGLALKQEGIFLPENPEEPLVIPMTKASQYFFAVPANTNRLLLICEQHHLWANVNNTDLVAMTQFDTVKARSRDLPQMTTGFYPHQYCRAAVMVRGQRQSISQLFKVEFQRTNLQTEWQNSPQLTSGPYLHLGQGVITNQTNVLIHLRIPTAGEQTLMVRESINSVVFEYKQGLKFNVLDQKVKNQMVVVPPGEKVTIQILASHRAICSPPPQPNGDIFGSGITVHHIWTWATNDVGPEWLQISDEKSPFVHVGKSSGVVPLLQKDYRRSGWKNAPLAPPPSFDEILGKDKPLKNCSLVP